MSDRKRARVSAWSKPRWIISLLGVTLVVVCLATACTSSRSHQASRPSPPATDRVTPGRDAVVLADGYAIAPAEAPVVVTRMIAAANEIVGLPHRLGGGHRPYPKSGATADSGYDGSGAVSWVLHAASLLSEPVLDAQLARYGQPDRGPVSGREQRHWVTIIVCPGHGYIEIAGIALDADPNDDPLATDVHVRWRPIDAAEDASCIARHPAGY